MDESEPEFTEAVYALRESGPLKVSIAFETGGEQLPVFVDIHGGGWCGGTRKTEISVMARDRAREGYLYLDIDYRLAPFHPYPQAIEDIHTALQWTVENASAYGGDPSRIALFGMSAGGHLAAMAALTTKIPIRCVVSWGAPYDYTNPLATEATKGHKNCVLAFLGECAHDRPDLYEAISTVRYLSADSPPMLALHGVKDEAVSVYHAQRLQEAARAIGALVEVCMLRDAGHIDPGPEDPDGSKVWAYIVNFIADHADPRGPIRPRHAQGLAIRK